MTLQNKYKMRNNELRPAVFLDRDGTIIEDCGHLRLLSQVRFFENTITSLQRLQEYFELLIVTNQSGVAKGIISMQDVERVNSYIESYLAEHGIRIVETYVCSHDRSDGCRCIKPNPFFLLKAKEEYMIDLKRSYVIGDHPHDVEFGRNVGANAIYVLSGHGRKHFEEVSEDTVVALGIREAVEYILDQEKISKDKE